MHADLSVPYLLRRARGFLRPPYVCYCIRLQLFLHHVRARDPICWNKNWFCNAMQECKFFNGDTKSHCASTWTNKISSKVTKCIEKIPWLHLYSNFLTLKSNCNSDNPPWIFLSLKLLNFEITIYIPSRNKNVTRPAVMIAMTEDAWLAVEASS